MNEILDKINHLKEQGFDIHTIKGAWYSKRSITNAFGGNGMSFPEVAVVRVGTPGGGMLELHPEEDKIKLLCYCCFEGDYHRGVTTLEELPEKLLELKDHYCHPWPG